MNDTQTDIPISTNADHQREKSEKKLLSVFDDSVGLNCLMCRHCRIKIRRDFEKGFEGLCCADRDKRVAVDVLHQVICRDFHFVGGAAHQMRYIALYNFRKHLRKLAEKKIASEKGEE